MKKNVFLLILFIFVYSCNSIKDNKNLKEFIHNYDKNMELYKVICFIPAEGCYTCLVPFIDYANKNTKGNMLLVVSSNRKKTVDDLINDHKIKAEDIVLDYKNLAAKLQLVSPIAPCVFLIKRGHINRKIDSEKILDKTSVIKEVDEYLLNN